MVSSVQGANLYSFIQQVSSQKFSQLEKSNDNFFVVNKDKWSEMIKSKDWENVDKTYKQSFKNLGESFGRYLDETFGNNDGKITYDEFKKSGLYETENGEQLLQTAFKNFDLNDDKGIDYKEWGAFFRLVDNSVNPNEKGCDNARLDAYSLAARMASMDKKIMKKNISDAYKDLFGNK